MPSSFVDSVPAVMKLAIEVNPRRVVDVGPGWGKYGLMCREYLPRLEELAAVEVHPTDAAFPVLQAVYDGVLIQDARKVEPEFWAGYQVALLIDMIEHMTIDEGHELLYAIQEGGCVPIVSTPKVFVHQHDADNPYEEHVSVWAWDDFTTHGIVTDASTIDSVVFRLKARRPL